MLTVCPVPVKGKHKSVSDMKITVTVKSSQKIPTRDDCQLLLAGHEYDEYDEYDEYGTSAQVKVKSINTSRSSAT